VLAAGGDSEGGQAVDVGLDQVALERESNEREHGQRAPQRAARPCGTDMLRMSNRTPHGQFLARPYDLTRSLTVVQCTTSRINLPHGIVSVAPIRCKTDILYCIRRTRPAVADISHTADVSFFSETPNLPRYP
jgi:hypothetical protein